MGKIPPFHCLIEIPYTNFPFKIGLPSNGKYLLNGSVQGKQKSSFVQSLNRNCKLTRGQAEQKQSIIIIHPHFVQT